jgi:hypothetical protein
VAADAKICNSRLPTRDATTPLSGSFRRGRTHPSHLAEGSLFPHRRPTSPNRERHVTGLPFEVTGRHLAYIIHRVEDVTEFVLSSSAAVSNKARWNEEFRRRALQIEAEVYLRAKERDSAWIAGEQANQDSSAGTRPRGRFISRHSCGRRPSRLTRHARSPSRGQTMFAGVDPVTRVLSGGHRSLPSRSGADQIPVRTR